MSILDILALPSPGLARGFLKQLRFFSLQKLNFLGGGDFKEPEVRNFEVDFW